MPPRIQSQRVSNALLPCLTESSASTSYLPSLCPSSRPASRQFSATPATQTKLRREMFEWLNGEGSALKHHIPGETNYLKKRGASLESGSTRPFPNNFLFISESILSEDLRNELYKQVVEQKKSLRAVSDWYRIDMRRVAAVVRLVELERRQRAQGKPLALPYARAIHEMVPVTPLAKDGERQPFHETINDLPAHPSAGAQIFYPVPESRPFNRVDAGRVFSGAPAMEREVAEKITHPSDLVDEVLENPHKIERVGKHDSARQVLQPADVRIPHPQLVKLELDRAAFPEERRTIGQRHSERLERIEEVERERRERAQAQREKRIKHVEPEGGRFEYRFQDVVFTKETTGANGRAPWAPGRRYGVPTDDRKRGTVKIPTSVEA